MHQPIMNACLLLLFMVCACQGFSVGSPMETSVRKLGGMVLHESEEDRERVPARKRRRDRYFEDDEQEGEADGYFGAAAVDDSDDEWLSSDDDEEYDLFGNELIPNPILDSIDPDGAAERFPELARDPRFWVDMCLFIAVLNFLSSIGPRNTFPLFHQ